MNDTLESDYAEMLHHINSVISDGKPEVIYIYDFFVFNQNSSSEIHLLVFPSCYPDYTHPETVDGVPIRKLFVSNLAERVCRFHFSLYHVSVFERCILKL